MNAAVRAVARAAFARRWEAVGIEAGYRGLLEDRLQPLSNRMVGGILQRGGTVLGTARSTEFATPEGQERAAKRLEEAGVEGLVVIGGGGKPTGAVWVGERGGTGGGKPGAMDDTAWGAEPAGGGDTALYTAL